MRKTITTISFLLSILAMVSFFSIDACLDAGGSWENWGLSCKGVGSEFIPQYKRVAPLFWLLVVFLSSMVAIVTDKVLPNAKQS